jgi:hypothetical protein
MSDIPENFDDFMNPQPETSKEGELEKETLENRFSRERLEWSGKIKDMSSQLKNVVQVGELMTSIYTERQRALEYYHYIISLLIQINKKYNKGYSDKWKFYTYQGNERFPNESAKNMRIQSELGDLKEKRELLDNHAKFMNSTVSTIDNIIFGIKTRVDIEQIARGK